MTRSVVCESVPPPPRVGDQGVDLVEEDDARAACLAFLRLRGSPA